MKPCPYCGEDIKQAAVKCRFCGEWLDPEKMPPWAQVLLTNAAAPVAVAPNPAAPPSSGAVASVPASAPAPAGPAAAPTPASPAAAPKPSFSPPAPSSGDPVAAASPAAPAEPTAPPTSGASTSATPEATPTSPAPTGHFAAVPSEDSRPQEEASPSMRAWEPPPWVTQQPASPQEHGAAPEFLASTPSEELLISEGTPAQPSAPTNAHPPLVDTRRHPTPVQPAPQREPRRQTLSRFPIAQSDAPVIPEPEPAPEDPGILYATSEDLPGPADTQAQDHASFDPNARHTQVRPHLGRAESLASDEALPDPAGNDDASVGDGATDEGANDEAMIPGAHRAVETPPNDAAAMIAAFMGDEDEDEDEDDALDASDSFDDLGGPAPRRAFPVLPAVMGVAVVGALAFAFRNELFGLDEGPATVAADAAAEAPSGAPAASGEPLAPKDLPAPADATPTGATGPSGAAAATGTAAPSDTGAAAASGTGAAESEGVGPQGPTDAADPETAGAPESPAPAPTPPKDPEALAAKLSEAQSLYERRKLKDAKALLQETLALAPNHPEALGLMSHVLLESGEADAALKTADTCVGIDAAQGECWLALAVIKQDRKEFAPALEAWKRYVEVDPQGRYVSAAKSEIRRLESKVGG